MKSAPSESSDAEVSHQFLFVRAKAEDLGRGKDKDRVYRSGHARLFKLVTGSWPLEDSHKVNSSGNLPHFLYLFQLVRRGWGGRIKMVTKHKNTPGSKKNTMKFEEKNNVFFQFLQYELVKVLRKMKYGIPKVDLEGRGG